jgi:sulfite exporter TauE/SafE
LPCGWLGMFLLLAASTVSPWRGAGVMGALWRGSLPALLFGASAFQWLRIHFKRLENPLRIAVMTLALVELTLHWMHSAHGPDFIRKDEAV